MLWIEAQSTPVITLLVFGVCYMLAAAIFCLAAILSRRRVAQDLKAVAPVTLTPLGGILGLVMVFLASRVWTNVDRAGEYVGQEAGALRETVLLADSLPQRSGRAYGRPSRGICISWSPKNGRQWHVDRPACGR